jgi:hypothetical protein
MKAHPEPIAAVYWLMSKFEFTQEEIVAAVAKMQGGTSRGRPEDNFYTPLLFAMCAYVVVCGRNRFTAARQILRLAGQPDDQLENRTRALVRRFDRALGDDKAVSDEMCRSIREAFGKFGASRIHSFWFCWELSGLPRPPDVKSPAEVRDEMRKLTKAAETDEEVLKIHLNYALALNSSLAQSNAH